jgi:hypothetical protein
LTCGVGGSAAIPGGYEAAVYLSSLTVRDDVEQQTDPITAFRANIEHLIEQSGLAGEAIGRPLRWQEISPETARQQMLIEGYPPSVVSGILNAHAKFATAPEPVSHTVEEVTGASARTFHKRAIDYADDFR